MKRSEFNEVFRTNFIVDFVWNLHPREGLYFLKTLQFLSLFKMGFQSKHLSSYDSNQVLRNLLFICFGKSLSNSNYESINVQLLFMFPTSTGGEIGQWLASEFHLGDLFLHLLSIKSCINQFVSRSNMLQKKNFYF